MIIRYLRGQRGAMLVDLTIAMVIAGIMAFTAITNFSGVKDDGYQAIAQAWVSNLTIAAQAYKRDIGVNPVNLAALAVAVGSKGPWMPMVPAADPWGTPYQYDVATGIISSAGPDKSVGTVDDIKLR